MAEWERQKQNVWGGGKGKGADWRHVEDLDMFNCVVHLI